MSYRLSHNKKNFWIKETPGVTEIHSNIDHGCSDVLVVKKTMTTAQITTLIDKEKLG